MSGKKLGLFQENQIVSHVPGRLRLKLRHEHRAPGMIRKIEKKLKEQEGFDKVNVNQTTGSVTISYDAKAHTMSDFKNTLTDLDIVIGELTGSPHIEEGEDASGKGSPYPVINAVDNLNARIHSLTGIPVDLKTAIPVGFAGAGAWSIASQGLNIGSIPGPLLLWMAFDTFIKLHPNMKQKQSPV